MEYYNPAYINFNNSGGDCANYVSQCISAGGMPQDSTWHYYFNGPGTSDDDYTTAWIYVPSHRQYFGRFGRTINDPVAADIAPGILCISTGVAMGVGTMLLYVLDTMLLECPL
ncbi:MAG: hypothetical protein GX033_00025 [Firmicutes bacterium]|nr:hypothetical protein [Bacillota bacterium]